MPKTLSAQQISELTRQKEVAKMLLEQSIDHYLEALASGALWDKNDLELALKLNEAVRILRRAA